MRDFLGMFDERKPIIGMIHCKGTDREDTLARAKREIDIYVQGGLDGCIVETYFGTLSNVVDVLSYLKEAHLPLVYGVNVLNVDAMGFEMARRYDCAFVQLDSVVGHVKPRDEESLAAFLEMERNSCNAAVMGGVRFKYQPVLSENTEEEDLHIAMGRCDAVAVTQNATGQETSMEKIERFRGALGDFPLFVTAGVTAEHAATQLSVCDGAVVGSYLKDTYTDSGDVSPEHVDKLMDAVRAFRAEL